MNYSDLNEQTIKTKYKPLSTLKYFCYLLLFSIPIVNIILLIILPFVGENVNRRNLAKGFLISFIISLIFILLYMLIFGPYTNIQFQLY